MNTYNDLTLIIVCYKSFSLIKKILIILKILKQLLLIIQIVIKLTI